MQRLVHDVCRVHGYEGGLGTVPAMHAPIIFLLALLTFITGTQRQLRECLRPPRASRVRRRPATRPAIAAGATPATNPGAGPAIRPNARGTQAAEHAAQAASPAALPLHPAHAAVTPHAPWPAACRPAAIAAQASASVTPQPRSFSKARVQSTFRTP
jgi:cell division septation protein DedD